MDCTNICFVWLLIVYDCVCGHEYNYPLSVDTPVGQIIGQRNDNFTMFLGVPYGVVNENNPFGAATPHPHFETPYEAFNDTVICPQIVKGLPTGSIHCLHLNIYTPNNVPQAPTLSVMVYIHGGAFVEGNGRMTTYNPKYFLKHDVIMITVNYRLGPYGHLCFTQSEYSNQALKDQQLALRWVNDNINSFGGDNNNILLFGHSSGSVSVDLHLLYANNNKLFNKVILQSGVSVIPYFSDASNSIFITTISKHIGLDPNTNIDIDEFVKDMSQISTDELIELTKDIAFRPCIDELLITKTPKTNNLQNLKVMIGGTSKEILFFHANVRDDFYEKYNFTTELQKGFHKISDALDVVKQFYLDNSKENIVEFGTDFVFNYPMERSIKYYLESNATVYRYLFSYDGGRNLIKIRDNITTTGAVHGDELGYLYDMPMFVSVTEEDQLIINRLSLLWTNFAKYGDPTPNETALIPVKWLPVSKESKPYLDINTNIELQTGPFLKNMAFWHLFYDKYGKYAKGISLGEKWSECSSE